MGEASWEGAVPWQDKLGLTRDAVRQDLVTRQLAEHLPKPSPEVRVLDVGCGQGTQAIRLASAGFSVVGVDPSDALLARARRAARDTRARVTFRRGTLENPGPEIGGGFDVVCCHGVLMYLPDLRSAVARLVGLARPGGLVSVLTRNRAGIAMRAGLTGDWEGALAGFDARHYRNRLGITGVRADHVGDVVTALRDSGADLLTWYGVRLFTDHWGDEPTPDEFPRLLDAEYEAGRRDPYRQVTSLTHVLARPRGSGSAPTGTSSTHPTA
jgi:S-adenosylmethionine-dependent methyltransferase